VGIFFSGSQSQSVDSNLRRNKLEQASQCESLVDLLRLLPQAGLLGGLDGIVGGSAVQFGSFAKKLEVTPVNFFGQTDVFNE